MHASACVLGASGGIGRALVEALAERREGGRIFASARDPASLRFEPGAAGGVEIVPLALDVEQEDTIERAATRVGAVAGPLDLLVNCVGVLHDGERMQPEKRLESIRPEVLQRSFAINAIGPLLVARHFHPLLDHGGRAVLATLSARVGSIGDNRRGGWYAYRVSKAAQNMGTRTLALELRRRAPAVICVALHPGTVDTGLSRPFQRNVPDAQLFEPRVAAEHLLAVIDGLGPQDSGSFFAWDGRPVPW